MDTKVIIGAALLTLLIIMIIYERTLSKLVKQYEELWRSHLKERRKNFELKRQIEYYNIFIKEMDFISKENNYGSIKNLENKIKSAIEDINRADKFLHFERTWKQEVKS